MLSVSVPHLLLLGLQRGGDEALEQGMCAVGAALEFGVELAGGENVYSDTDQEFLTVNTEDIKTKEPDIILRAAHALPDQVVEMFNKDFAENDIWQHFDAVKNGRVYDLTYEYFGMSATFKYPQALEELQPILYPESDEDSAKAKETSDNAQKKAKDSDATEKYNEQQSK